MPNTTYTHADLVKIEREFIAHLATLGGWRRDNPAVMYEQERAVVDRWLDNGRLRKATKGGWDVVELTAAGWQWCEQNGISR